MTSTDILKNGFTDKATYLVWRKTWKETYAELTKEIRLNKAARKNTDPAIRSGCQYLCWRQRHEAAKLLEQRKQSKIEAQRQYLASRCLQPSPC